MYKISFTDYFEDELDEAHEYLLAKSDSETIVEKYFKAFYEKLVSIKEMAYIWSLVDDDVLANKGFRSFLVKNYLVFYKVIEDEETVYIHRFLHSSRDWANILKEDLEDEN